MLYYLLTQAKASEINTFNCDMLTFIRCGSFISESIPTGSDDEDIKSISLSFLCISQHESIFNSILTERRWYFVQKISGSFRKNEQNGISDIKRNRN